MARAELVVSPQKATRLSEGVRPQPQTLQRLYIDAWPLGSGAGDSSLRATFCGGLQRGQ